MTVRLDAREGQNLRAAHLVFPAARIRHVGTDMPPLAGPHNPPSPTRNFFFPEKVSAAKSAVHPPLPIQRPRIAPSNILEPAKP
ncbi:hypothetical protein NL676_003889 [Syzygium grande]|nr:hypothetical protein NL676_003889 [Syzygium grande]